MSKHRADQLPEFFVGTEMPDADWWQTLWPEPARVLARVGIKPGQDVIDLCSSDGWFTLQIAKIARHVVAIDSDPALLETARGRLSRNGITNCDFMAGSAHDLAELYPQPVDFAFLANAFHGVPDRSRLARSIADVLNPFGRLAVVNWHARPREQTTILDMPHGPATELRMTPEQTIYAIEFDRLRFAELVDLAPYHYAAIFERI